MAKIKENWKKVPKWLQIVIYSVLGALGMAAIGVLFGYVIMRLWNWLMPELFGLKAITYWQGVGLFILAKIFFGAISGSSSSSKTMDKKERRSGPQKGGEHKAESGEVEYYDEWWEKEGKASFDHFTVDRFTSQKADETASDKGKMG